MFFFIVLHGFKYNLTKPLYVMTNKLKSGIIHVTWVVTNDLNDKTVTVPLASYKNQTLVKKFKRIGKFNSRFKIFFSFILLPWKKSYISIAQLILNCCEFLIPELCDSLLLVGAAHAVIHRCRFLNLYDIKCMWLLHYHL